MSTVGGCGAVPAESALVRRDVAGQPSRFPSFSLDGKAAVVTGASSGIGSAIAVAMAEAGAKVALVGRNVDRLRKTAEQIPEHHVVAIDLVEDGAPERIVDETVQAFGRLDSLVHSAGVFWPKPIEEATLDEFDTHWQVNVRAPYLLTRAALPYLERDSAVIFISSIAGQVAFPNSAAYCATKGAIELLTKALAAELSPRGIRVNAVAPGNIRTPMNDTFFASQEYERSMIERTPYGRVGVVEDIAPVAVFLASDAARYIHGESILVDGAWAAQ